jgi:diacylglycerol kinase (ATP)
LWGKELIGPSPSVSAKFQNSFFRQNAEHRVVIEIKTCYTANMKYWIKRLSHPLRGLKYAFTRDFAVQFEIIVFGIIGLPLAYFLFELSAKELLLLIFCWFFIVVTEIQNSAIEIALTKLHPEHDKAIGQSKDLASASVVWAFIFGLICLFFVLSGKV